MRRRFSKFLALFTRKQTSQVVAPSVVYLPLDIVEATAQLLVSFGTSTEYHEGIVYWAGVPSTPAWIVTTVLVPEAITTPGSYQTSAVANAQIISKVNEFRLQLLAQVHGHPGEWVGHSAGDDKGAFMPYPGFYSVVVPNYGCHDLIPLCKCGIHRYEEDHFKQLTQEEIDQLFVIIPTAVDLRRAYD